MCGMPEQSVTGNQVDRNWTLKFIYVGAWVEPCMYLKRRPWADDVANIASTALPLLAEFQGVGALFAVELLIMMSGSKSDSRIVVQLP